MTEDEHKRHKRKLYDYINRKPTIPWDENTVGGIDMSAALDYMEEMRNAWKKEETFHYTSEYDKKAEDYVNSTKSRPVKPGETFHFDGPRKEGQIRIVDVRVHDSSPEGMIRSLWPGRRRYRFPAPVLDESKIFFVNDRIMRPVQGVVYEYWICYGPLKGAKIPDEVIDELKLAKYPNQRLECLIACCAHDECIPFEEI